MKPASVICGSLVLLPSVLHALPAEGSEGTTPPGLLPKPASPAPDTPSSMTDIHDILPPISLGIDGPWLLPALVTLAVLAILAAAWWWWKKGKKNRAIETIIPELPPEMVAMRSLDGLTDVRRMDAKTFYFRLSAILRQYVFGRFAVGAPEMTTEEFLPCIGKLSVDTTLTGRLKHLCREMDPVKFGAETTTEKQMLTDLAFAREFVTKTTRAAEPAIKNGNGELLQAPDPTVS